ncbi:protein DENND6B, partial [Protobothrops mucrosquamatus]|uniref:protein DENND6B n=1 Tax=Protobothrops mucrosquamatus TaxID=103944 RepID=UPI0010FB86EC
NRAAQTSKAPWGRLSAWLECVCAVTFDLELGQALERIYPPEGSLTEKERTSVCYLAFPDSYSGSLGDTQFSFRFRRSAGRRGAAEGERRCSREAPPGLQPEPAHLFGYVFFRQVRDRSVQRGYFQKSLVLVTRLPYVNLFHSLLHLVAPEYFEKLDPCLEAVCSEIDQWPPPVPGQTLNLPVMGVVIQVRIPSRGDKPGSCPPAKPLIRENLLPAPLALPSVAELDLFRCFQSVLVHIQLLWELVLLGEPLVIVAPSPTMSSEVVLALASCLAPLKYCCDFHPYFTIHDSEFKEYTTRTQGPPSVLLGVTNPFFIKMLQHWPHILRLGELWMAGDLPKQVKLKKLAKLKTLDTKPGLYTSYRTFLHKDKTLIKRLLKGIQKKRPSEAQSALLRRQLLELTQSFIIPLEHYMASLMPLQRTITPWKTPPRIRPFHQEDFLKSLEHAGPQLTCVLKGDWLGLYRRFFKSPNFDGWFRQRHREMRHKLEALHLEAIAEANVGAWMVDKSEAEAVDLVLKLREKLVQARSRGLPAREETLQRVCQHITVVVRSLPEDLQAVLCHQEMAAAS